MKKNHLELWGVQRFIPPSLDGLGLSSKVLNYLKIWPQNFNKQNKNSLVLLNNAKVSLSVSGWLVKQLYDSQQLKRRVSIIDVPEYLIQLTSMIEKNERDSKILDDLVSCDLIIFTEIGLIKVNENQRGRLYTLINRRFMQNKPFIATSSIPVDELENNIGEAIFARIVNSCQFLDLSNA